MDELVVLSPREFRAVRTTAYLLMTAAGLILPAFVVSEVERPSIWLLMCGLLVIGGSVCSWGQVTGRWTGEYIGIWPLISALFTFGLMQALISGLPATPSTALLWAFALLLFARWRDIAALRKAPRPPQEEL